MKTKILFALLIILLAVPLTLIEAHPAKAIVGLEGWRYRQSITLTGTSAGAQDAGYNKSFKVVYADPWWTTGPKDSYTPLGLEGFQASDWSPDGVYLYALKNYHVYRSADSGLTFTDIATVPTAGDPHPTHAGKGMCCFVNSDGYLFVGFGSTRKLYRCTSPSTADAIEDFSVVLVTASGNAAGYTDDGWIFNVTEDAEGVLYATTYGMVERVESRVVKSTDSGATWNKCRGLEGALDWDTSEGAANADLTTDINDADVGDATFFQDLTTNDSVRFCFYNRSNRITVNMATAGVGTYTCNWWYWAVNLANPSGAWAVLSGVDAVDSTGADKANGEYFKATGEYEIYWTLPTDWAESTLGGITGYWVACYINTGAPTTSPVATQAWSASTKSFVARHMHLTKYSSVNNAVYAYPGEYTDTAVVTSDLFSDNANLTSIQVREGGGGGSYTDETTDALDSDANDWNLMAASPQVNDCNFFGFAEPSRRIDLKVGTAGVGTWTITWYYYATDDTWKTLSGVTGTSANFTQWKASGEGYVEWTLPTDWKANSVNGVTAYHVGANVNAYTSTTTQPLGTQILDIDPEANFLWKTTDAGDTWAKVSVYPKQATALGVKADYVYIGEELLDGTANQIFRLQDGGSGPYGWTSIYTLPTGYASFSSFAISNSGAMMAGTYAEAGLTATDMTLYIVASTTGGVGTWRVIAKHQLAATWDTANAYLGWPTAHPERANGHMICSIGASDLAGVPQNFFMVEKTTFNTIFTETKCQTDFDDVRMTTSDGTTQVPIIKNPYASTDSQEAEFWCRLPDATPANGNTQTFYIYYGKSNASAPTYTLTDVFPLADDFDDGDTTGWTQTSGTWAATSGGLPSSGYFVREATATGYSRMKTAFTDAANAKYSYSAYVKCNASATWASITAKSSNTDKNTYDQGFLAILDFQTGAMVRLYNVDGDTLGQIGTVYNAGDLSNLIVADTWIKLTFSWANLTAGLGVALDDCGYIAATENTANTDWNSGGCVRLGKGAGGANNTDYDWFFVRPTVDWTQYDEPKWTSIGGQELLVGGGISVLGGNF